MSTALVSIETVGRVRTEGLVAAAEAVGLEGAPDDVESILGSLLLAITGSAEDIQECTSADIAGINSTDLEGVLSAWSISGVEVSVMNKSRARRFHNACHAACVQQWTPEAAVQPAAASGPDWPALTEALVNELALNRA